VTVSYTIIASIYGTELRVSGLPEPDAHWLFSLWSGLWQDQFLARESVDVSCWLGDECIA